ncbi:MAG TPA: OmpH family outer membrane protein [Sedimentisphaerales bacterium]|nr:OmpH family outer membrane protein [Sedimentisphaerales bacterium]
MKVKTAILGCLIGVVVLLFVHEYSMAQVKTNDTVLPIGIVDVRRALRECKATDKYRERTNAENSKMDAEEEQLSREIQALAAGLRALKPGTSDHLAQYKEYLQKQANLKTLQEFNPQQKALKHQQWTQELYQEILRITKVLAAEKGLPLVLESDEPEFPIQRYEDLAMTLSTHKVLYSNGCLDLTDEVIAELDKEESKFIN